MLDVVHTVFRVAFWLALLILNGYGLWRVFLKAPLIQGSTSEAISLSTGQANANVAPADSKAAKPSRKSLIVLLLLVADAVTFSVLPFVLKHPGLMMVFFGVIGENIWEDKTPKAGKLMYRFSAALLMIGLAAEIPEAAAADEHAAEMEKEAAEARLELARITPENLPINFLEIEFRMQVKGAFLLDEAIPRGESLIFNRGCDLELNQRDGEPMILKTAEMGFDANGEPPYLRERATAPHTQ